MSYYILPAIFIFGWIIFWSFCYLASRYHSKSLPNRINLPTDDKSTRRQFYTITLFSCFMYFAGFWEITLLQYPSFFTPIVFQEVAVLVYLLGIFIAMFAAWNIRLLSLSEMLFSISPHKINTGPYKFIRHPMYTGISLAFLGFLLAYPTFIGLVSFFVIVYIFSVRATREESVES